MQDQNDKKKTDYKGESPLFPPHNYDSLPDVPCDICSEERGGREMVIVDMEKVDYVDVCERCKDEHLKGRSGEFTCTLCGAGLSAIGEGDNHLIGKNDTSAWVAHICSGCRTEIVGDGEVEI